MLRSRKRVLSLLSSVVAVINAQDAKTATFPPNGNGSAMEFGSSVEFTRGPEMVRTSALVTGPSNTLAASYFQPGPQRAFYHHRSESTPYVYDYPSVVYPVAHSADHSIAPTSKHLVVVSFIGLLLLFAVIQNTLTAVKRRDALIEVLSSRQKRDIYAAHDFNSVTPEQEDVLNEDARVRCIQRTVCLENQKLLKDLGNTGRILAKYLTRAVEKSVKSASGWDRLVEDAGAAGLRGDDCSVLYRDCDTAVAAGRRDVTKDSEATRLI